jgi:hypothetical protein
MVRLAIINKSASKTPQFPPWPTAPDLPQSASNAAICGDGRLLRYALNPATINSTYFGLLAEFGEANIPLEKVAPKYFGLSYAEARRRAPAKMLPCRALRLGGQKSPWLVSAMDLAELIDAQRERAR